jgi:hypothetical protein
MNDSSENNHVVTNLFVIFLSYIFLLAKLEQKNVGQENSEIFAFMSRQLIGGGYWL